LRGKKNTPAGVQWRRVGESKIAAYIVGWQWYDAAYWKEFRGAREKQNERERERERDQNHMRVAGPGAKKKQKTN
jgi:hypothetical protein